MIELSLPAVLVTDPANVFYFSKFAGSPGDGILLITLDHLWILTDTRYTLQVAEQCPSYTILGSSAADISSIGEILKHYNITKVGFENEKISYSLWHRLTAKFQNIFFVPINDLFMQLRSIKDDREVYCIRKSCQIAVDSLRETLPYIQAGTTERDIALELEYRMRKNGAACPSFDTIVASGIRSALPHGVATTRIIQAGEPVTIDFGAVYEGYCSDMTRTFFVGEPSAQMISIYRAVYDAQQAAIQSFYPGISSFELDRIAREVLKDAGYDAFFIHSLGHGVGIEIHEGITIGRKRATSISAGMVFSIEPGVYIDGVGGVRIEDLVLCTDDGLLNLTDGFQKELAIL